jgi:hypothetical protein
MALIEEVGSSSAFAAGFSEVTAALVVEGDGATLLA